MGVYDYQKQTFVDNQTILNAAHLDHIEAGIHEMDDILGNRVEHVQLDLVLGGITSGGGVQNRNDRIRSVSGSTFIPIAQEGDIVSVSDTYKYRVAIYDSRTLISNNLYEFADSAWHTGSFRIDKKYAGKYVALVFANALNDSADLTNDVAEMHNHVRYYRTIPARPLYVAFGPSTTAGAVHRQGASIIYSTNNYPQYIGRALNMDVKNLGVGSTGFMKRGDIGGTGYGDPASKPNICDQILAEDNQPYLEKASLITIMFGYGNDFNCGTSSTAKIFPIGEYDDYYDYAAAKESIQDFNTAQGQINMIDDGATLLGCLNWCLKYLNEHYPYAQVILIFGSPSANAYRTIQVDNEHHKLIFGDDPYYAASKIGTSSAEKGIWNLELELNKLREKINVPVVDMFYDGNAFTYYSTYSKDPSNPDNYALFSTTGTTQAPTWNSHPNDEGYAYYARVVGGKVVSLFRYSALN